MKTDGPLILYVDDERPNRVVFEQSFGQRFRIQSVDSGPKALELMRKERVAVLVTDQRMPEMTGHDLLVRAKAEFPDVVRVTITAYGDLEPILQAVNQGLVARYIIKPWNRAELEEILRWAVEAFELGRQDSALQLRLIQNERLATLGSIVSAMLHDLNQPLANVSLNADRMNDHAAMAAAFGTLIAGGEVSSTDLDRLVECQRELPEIASDLAQSAKVMRELLTHMRSYLQPSRAKQEPLATDPMAIIRYAMNVCRETVNLARGRMLYDGPAELPKVRIGATELSQIFINLIANAAQALLRREQTGGSVKVHAVRDPDRMRFAVEDDGPGMPADVLARVGTPFFSTRDEGTGLGVSQVKRRVGSAGGTIEITSTVGKGTTVTFTLPIA